MNFHGIKGEAMQQAFGCRPELLDSLFYRHAMHFEYRGNFAGCICYYYLAGR